MSTKLIQTQDYLLLIDEESRGIAFGEIGVNMRHSKLEVETRNIGGYGSDKYYWSHKKCLAYYPLTPEAKELEGLPKLPNPFKEIDVEKLALEKYQYTSANPPYSTITPRDKISGFIEGYKAAQSKQFSLEDIQKAFEAGVAWHVNPNISEIDAYTSFIQSLSTQQLPSEFIPETYCNYGDDCPSKGAYDKQHLCDIRIKTITNSEGKQELVGVWRSNKN